MKNKMIKKTGVVLKVFLTICLSRVICEHNSCPHYADYEVLDNCAGCGVCQASQSTNKGSCHWNFLEDYFYDEKQCRLVNHCKSKNPCKPLTCLPLFGTFKCQCESSKFGRKCSFSRVQGISYAVVEEVIFTPMFSMNKFATVSVFFSNIGSEMMVELSTYYGMFNYNQEICETPTDIKDYCKKLFSDYQTLCENNPSISNKNRPIKCVITINFGYPTTTIHKGFEDSISFYHPFKEGYDSVLIIPFSLKITNGLNKNLAESTFENEYIFLIALMGPKIGLCKPVVSFRNAGSNMLKAIEYTAKEEIVLTGSYQNSKNCAGPSDNVMIRLDIWKVEVNHNEINGKPFFSLLNENSVILKPFSLASGMYKVKFSVSLWYGPKENIGFNYYFFSVKDLDLVAVIEGGSQKTLYFEDTLELNGSLSMDPNLDPSRQQESLYYGWKCDKHVDFCEEQFSMYTIKYTGPFEKKETYTFTLTVYSKLNKFKSSSFSQKIFVSDKKVENLEIVCKRNCGNGDLRSNPDEVIYLEVKVSKDPLLIKFARSIFHWSYSEETKQEFGSVEQLKQEGTPSSVLIIRKNVLSEGKTYVFKVYSSSYNFVEDVMKIKIAEKVSNFSCKPDIDFAKTDVTRGVTVFNVECDRVYYKGLSTVYDFYDKSPDSDDLGRLILSSKSNTAQLVVVTRGKLAVTVTNEYGMTATTEFTIKNIHDEEDWTEVILTHLEDLKMSLSTSDTYNKTNIMSIVVDLIATKNHNLADVSSILEYFLKITSEAKIESISDLKVWTATVNCISDLTTKENLRLSMKSISYLSKAVRSLSMKLNYEIKVDGTISDELKNKDIYQLAQVMLNICSKIYNSSKADSQIARIIPNDLYVLHQSYREISAFLVRSVERIMLCISLVMLPYESPVKMKGLNGIISIWVKEDIPESFVGNRVEPYQVNISKLLAKSISKSYKFITLQVAEFDDDPYWYNPEFNIHTIAVVLRVRYKSGNKMPDIDPIQHPISINLTYSDTDASIVYGSVHQPLASDSIEENDTKVAIHQLRVPNIGRLDIKFQNLKEGQSLVVNIKFNIRPDYDLMSDSEAVIVNKTSLVVSYPLKDHRSHDLYDLYYIGILPGPEVPPGQVLNYSFITSTWHCASWDVYEWITAGCGVQEDVTTFLNSNATSTGNKELHCECTHLSTFAGFSQVPINTINPFKDYKLFLNIHNNPFVAILVLSMLCLYGILLVWALWRDSIEKFKGGAIYLEDNFPQDEFAYLVAVYTGNKFFSGTSSNLAIAVEGDQSSSRVHLLRHSHYRTLERGDDNWFVLMAPNYLGSLKLIHIWMDYSGRSPEWYCYKIVIVDLSTNKQYLFLVDSWMSLKEEEFVERYVEVSNSQEDQRFTMAIDNLVFGFRETHLWLSVVSRHPRSTVSRAQRLSLAVCGVLVTMLVSCMFYGVIDDKEEDLPQFAVGLREFMVGITSMIISTGLISIVISAYRRTLVFEEFEGAEVLEDEDEEGTDRKKLYRKKGKKEKICDRCCEDYMKAFVKKKKFQPVFLNTEKAYEEQKRTRFDTCWLIFSWTTCLSMIVICSFLVVLYGLKFGKVKSLEWLTSVGMSVVEVILFTAPIKIVTFTLMSGILFSNLFEVISHGIKNELLLKYKQTYLDSKEDLDLKLISLRSQKGYVPLRYEVLMKKLHKQRKKDASWLLLDMFLLGLVLVMTLQQNGNMWTSKFYLNNHQFKHLLRKEHKDDIQIYELKNLSLHSLFLEKKLFPRIYQCSWYNGQPIDEENTPLELKSSYGSTSKLIGLPRLRQIRLRPDVCVKPEFENLLPKCDTKLTDYTEDTDLYSESWGNQVPDLLSPWSYVTETDEDMHAYFNLPYTGNGYIAELHLTEEKSEDVVFYLDREQWLDNLTSAVVFELTMYNAFTRTFTFVMTITENLHIGMLRNLVYVSTISDRYDLSLIDVVFIFIMLLFTLRVFFFVNRNGIDKLVKNVWNIVEILIVCLTITSMTLVVQNNVVKLDYFKVFDSGARLHYFKFFKLTTYLDQLLLVLVVLEVLLVCRFLKCWKFTKTFGFFFYTLLNSCEEIMWLFAYLTSITFVHWRFILYFQNNFVIAKNSVLIKSEMDFRQVIKDCDSIFSKVNPFVLCSFSYLVKLLIQMYLICVYKVTRRKYNETECLNFFTIFCKNPKVPSNLNKNKRSKVFIST